MHTKHRIASLLSFALLLPCTALAGGPVPPSFFTLEKQCWNAEGTSSIPCSGSFDFVVTDPFNTTMSVTLGDGDWQATVPIADGSGFQTLSLDSMLTSSGGMYTIQEKDPGELWQLFNISVLDNGGDTFAACLGDCGSEPVIDINDRKVTFQPFGGETVIFRNRQVPQVPIPAALWLFGSGLLGLAGMARRNRAA